MRVIISCHNVMKTQILSKVSFCIFHDANHYKNNQNDQRQVSWSHLNSRILNSWNSWILNSLSFFFLSQKLQCHSHPLLLCSMGWNLLITSNQKVSLKNPDEYPKISCHMSWFYLKGCYNIKCVMENSYHS